LKASDIHGKKLIKTSKNNVEERVYSDPRVTARKSL